MTPIWGTLMIDQLKITAVLLFGALFVSVPAPVKAQSKTGDINSLLIDGKKGGKRKGTGVSRPPDAVAPIKRPKTHRAFNATSGGRADFIENFTPEQAAMLLTEMGVENRVHHDALNNSWVDIGKVRDGEYIDFVRGKSGFAYMTFTYGLNFPKKRWDEFSAEKVNDFNKISYNTYVVKRKVGDKYRLNLRLVIWVADGLHRRSFISNYSLYRDAQDRYIEHFDLD